MSDIFGHVAIDTPATTDVVEVQRITDNRVQRLKMPLSNVALNGVAQTVTASQTFSGANTFSGVNTYSARPVFSVGYGTGTAGAAGSVDYKVFAKTGIADNTATSIITVTVPNGNVNGAVFLDIVGHLGTGTDVSESTRCATGVVAFARKTGANVVAVASTLAQAQIATVSGGGTLTLAYGVSAVAGAVGAVNTFDIQVTLVVTGTITDHTALVGARLLNSLATGATMAASA
jgi:hypothetical protein